jgi:glycosyltransferase involved in cell wall biosynthesis
MGELRALHVHSGNLMGGVETVLLTLARFRELAPGLEQHYALSFEGKLSSALAAEGVPVWILGQVRTSRPWTVRRGRRALRDLIEEIDAQVVLCHGPWPQAVFGPAARTAGRPLVFWQHGALSGHHWLERMARRTPPDLAICNSRFSQQSLPSLYPDVESTVVYCPVAEPDSAALRPRADLRRELGTPADRPVVIQVSRMEQWKGHALHIDALARLRDPTDWECWIVGGAQRPDEVKYQSEMERRAAAAGLGEKIRFLGQRSDVPDLLAAADIFCQPNKGPEPFGIVFVEALYAGLPVVTTRMGGAVEIVDDNTGVLVAPDAGALASALRALLTDSGQRARLGELGPDRARELSEPQHQLRRLQETLQALPLGAE